MRGGGSHVILLRVDDLQRLFERLDASPLVGRHLDARVDQFILHHADEARSPDYSLVVQYSGEEAAQDHARLSEAIRQHFAHRSQEERRKLAGIIGETRRDLAIGLAFLFVCALLGVVALKLLPAPLDLFIEQGLLIIGWVALWRPVDLLLYELRPIRTRLSTLERLSSVQVSFERTL